MTFDAFETADGSPIELLQFSNGLLTFRYANTIQPIQIGSFVYEPLAYTRSSWSQSKDKDDNNIRLKAPNDWPVAALYQGRLTSNTTSVTISRFHADDPAEQVQVAWKGQIVALKYAGDNVEVLLQPLTKGSERTPPDTVSFQCNAFLFQSPGCNLTSDDWKFIGTATAISPDQLEITFSGLRLHAVALDLAQGGPGSLTAAELDTYFQGGHLVTGAGEVRDIIEGDVGGDPDTVRIQIPFRDFSAGQGANVFAGCRLTLDICERKFNNAINFQGYAYVPVIDPANTELPPGSRTSGSKFSGIQT